MAEDRRTKAELREALAGALDERDQALADEEAARDHIADMDLEAKIIAGCTASLDLFPAPPTSRDLGSLTFGGGPPEPERGDPRIARVLAYLADRYRLPDPAGEIKRLRTDLAEERREHAATRRLLDQARERIEAVRHQVDAGGPAWR